LDDFLLCSVFEDSVTIFVLSSFGSNKTKTQKYKRKRNETWRYADSALLLEMFEMAITYSMLLYLVQVLATQMSAV
jgi:hypothetical protein